jgi:L-alanine-DL-glutamate epimerase-like enolase superfamily enzyme
MQITDLTVFLAKDWRPYLFVILDTDAGIYGIGESGLTSRELAVAGALEHFKPLLIGQDPFRIEHLWQTLYRGGFFPAEGAVAAAVSAIDIALWDIKGKALGVPVYELLGGRVRDYVTCYTHVSGATVPELVQACRRAVDDGWTYLRWGIAHHPSLILEPRVAVDSALREFEAIRTAVGDEIELVLDLHTRLNLPDALRLCREAEAFRPYFIEDPLRSENPDSFKTLRARTTVPLAAGEQFTSKWQFRQLIEEEWIDYARPDLCLCGGFTEAKKIAGWCETHAIDIAVHNPLGVVSGTTCLHFNLALPNFAVQELPHHPGQSMPDAFTGQPRLEAGRLYSLEKPGLGLEVDRAALARYTFTPFELPHLRRADGAFTNW